MGFYGEVLSHKVMLPVANCFKYACLISAPCNVREKNATGVHFG